MADGTTLDAVEKMVKKLEPIAAEHSQRLDAHQHALGDLVFKVLTIEGKLDRILQLVTKKFGATHPVTTSSTITTTTSSTPTTTTTIDQLAELDPQLHQPSIPPIETGASKHVPLTVFVDLEPTMIDNTIFSNNSGDEQRKPIISGEQLDNNSYDDFSKYGIQKVFDSIEEIVIEQGFDSSKRGDGEWRYALVKFGKVSLDTPTLESNSDDIISDFEGNSNILWVERFDKQFLGMNDMQQGSEVNISDGTFFFFFIEYYAKFESYDDSIRILDDIEKGFGFKPGTFSYNLLLNVLIDENHTIVSSSVGPEYYIGILSFVDKDQFEPGCAILLRNKVLSVVEVLRSCTAEHKTTDIAWTIKKYITRCFSLLTSNHTLAVYLDNLVDSTCIGVYHVKIYMHLYPAEVEHSCNEADSDSLRNNYDSHADLILPVSRTLPLDEGLWFEVVNSTDLDSNLGLIIHNYLKLTKQFQVEEKEVMLKGDSNVMLEPIMYQGIRRSLSTNSVASYYSLTLCMEHDMGSDLFGSHAEALCATLVVATISSFVNNHQFVAVCYPSLISSMGILVCLITTLFATDFFEIKVVKEIEPVLKNQLIISTVLMTLGIAIVTWIALPSSFTIFNFGVQKDVKNLQLFLCVAVVLWADFVIGFVIEFYTSNSYSPVQDVVDSCRTGAATNVNFGLALGYKFVIIPILAIAISIFVSFSFATMYDITPLDVDIKNCGKVVVLYTKNLPLVGAVGLGADLVRLNGSTMCFPGFFCNSALQVTYIVR